MKDSLSRLSVLNLYFFPCVVFTPRETPQSLSIEFVVMGGLKTFLVFFYDLLTSAVFKP